MFCRLSDASGKMTFKIEKSGAVSTSDLDSKVSSQLQGLTTYL